MIGSFKLLPVFRLFLPASNCIIYSRGYKNSNIPGMRSSGDRGPFLLELLQLSGADQARNKVDRKNESFGKDSAMIPWLNERPPIQMNRCSSMAQRAIRPDGR